MGGGGILCDGWLVKSPPLRKKSVKRWKKRWFVLRQSNILEYYEEKTSKEPKGKINLEDCTSIGANLALKKGKYMFDIETPGRVFYFCAESQDELNRWVSMLCERCGFDNQAASGGRGTTLPSGQRPVSESVSVMRNTGTLPNSFESRSRRAQTFDALSPVEDTLTEDQALRSDYCLAGDITNGAAAGTPSNSRGVYAESTGVMRETPESASLSRRLSDLQIDPSAAPHSRAASTYDMVPRPVSRVSRSATMPLDVALAEMSSSERYVPLPTLAGEAVNPSPSKGRQPYQIPPAPRPYISSAHPPPPASDPPMDGPSGFYSYPPAPRPSLPPKGGGFVGAESPPPPPLSTPPVNSQYDYPNPDYLDDAPRVDRTSKPRNSFEGIADPDAPPIDRSSKPVPMLRRSGSSPNALEGAAFDHLPLATENSKRFSRMGTYTIPPTATPLTVELAVDLYNRPAPMVTPSNPDVGPLANYSYPPPAGPTTHTPLSPVNALMHLQLQPHSVPPPPPPDDEDPRLAYSIPPSFPGHMSPEHQQVLVQRRLSGQGVGRAGSFREPNTNYSYPPPPVHRSSVHAAPMGPDGAYSYPPPPRKVADNPDGRPNPALVPENETEIAYTDMRNGVMGEYYTHMDQNGAVAIAGDEFYSAVPNPLAQSGAPPGQFTQMGTSPRPVLPPKPT